MINLSRGTTNPLIFLFANDGNEKRPFFIGLFLLSMEQILPNLKASHFLLLSTTKERTKVSDKMSAFWVKTSDIRCKTSDMSGKIGFFIFTVTKPRVQKMHFSLLFFEHLYFASYNSLTSEFFNAQRKHKIMFF